jgi:hypothetical protein
VRWRDRVIIVVLGLGGCGHEPQAVTDAGSGTDAGSTDGPPTIDASAATDASNTSCLSGTPQVDPGLADAEVVISHLHNIYALGFTASSLYVLTWDGLFRADRDPCSLHLLVPQPVYEFAVDETALYWPNASGTVMTMPPLGGPETVFYNPSGFNSMALGTDALFLSIGYLTRIPRDGGPAITLDGPEVASAQIAVDGSDLYYFYSSSPGGDYEDLVRIDPVTGGDRQIVVPNAITISDTITTVVDPTHVYWISYAALARGRRDMTGGVEPVAEFTHSSEAPITQDAEYVYYATNVYTTGSWHGEIVRVRKLNLSSDVIASAEGAFRALGVDGGYLYFGVGFEGNFDERKEWVGRLAL